ncbi:DNA adenine methylase [Undibacterium sp. Tian12W]|uniref:DNA adenine methylase n=1 Tax=Undibacterium sp. Tian12W TaxID=3413054 RepID=UPI003BF01D98
MANFHSPLRYPGGKNKLIEYVKALFRHNELMDGDYVEPYAGGSSIALALAIHEYAAHVHINDIDPSVWSFWYSVLNDTDELCKKISDTPINMETWIKQREIQKNKADADTLTLGFSTFFLNRTNRSGILNAGVIGGKNQDGNFKIDARFKKEDLINRIQLIGEHRSRISLYNLDAVTLLKEVVPTLQKKTLVYLDPPYYVKGGDLYEHHYKHDDHSKVAKAAAKIKQHVMISYDDVPEIRELYKKYQFVSYSLSYCAQNRYRGTEAIFLGNTLECPGLKASMQAA